MKDQRRFIVRQTYFDVCDLSKPVAQTCVPRSTIASTGRPFRNIVSTCMLWLNLTPSDPIVSLNLLGVADVFLHTSHWSAMSAIVDRVMVSVLSFDARQSRFFDARIDGCPNVWWMVRSSFYV